MKEVYFSHDSGARRDPKVLKLRSKYGAEGYGWYFMIIEILREQDDYTFPYSDEFDVAGLSMELGTTPEHLSIFIQDCIEKFLLLKLENGKLFSSSLNDRMDKMEEISEKRKSAIAKRWAATNTNEVQTDTKDKSKNTNVLQDDTNVLQMYYKSTEKEIETEIEKEKEIIEEFKQVKKGKPVGFNAILLVLFCAQYELTREIPYTVKRDRDEKHMNGIFKQYLVLKKAKNETPDTEQVYREMRLLFRLACLVEDEWIYTNMSPPIMDSKFNQVMALIKQSNGKKNNGTANNTKRKLTDEDILEVGTRIFDLNSAGAVG